MSDDIPTPPSNEGIPAPPEPEHDGEDEKPLEDAIDGEEGPWDEYIDDDWFDDGPFDPRHYEGPF